MAQITTYVQCPQYARLAGGLTISLTIPLYSGMILATMQRFFAIWLHLRYETSTLYLHRTKYVVCTWVASLLFSAANVSVYLTQNLESEAWNMFLKIIPSIGLFGTNIIFFIVYTYIYIKYRKATNDLRTSLYRKRKAKIFTPFVICLSFFMFGTLPHLFKSQVSDVRYSHFWFYLDGISNSFVYVFMNKNVLVWFTKCGNKNRIASQQTTS